MDFIVTLKISTELEILESTVVLEIFNGDYSVYLFSHEVMSREAPLKEKNKCFINHFYYPTNALNYIKLRD